MHVAGDERRGRRFERGKQLDQRRVFVMEPDADADAAVGAARLRGQAFAAGNGGPDRGRQLFDSFCRLAEAIASLSPSNKSARLVLAVARSPATRARSAGGSLASEARRSAIMRRCSKMA